MALFEAAALHVNRANPNIFVYLSSAYERYAPIEGTYAVTSMTAIRNNLDVRRMICEAAAVTALSRKSKLPSLPTIKPIHDFDAVTVQESIKAPSTLYGKLVLRKEDPMLVAIPINEFSYCLRQDIRDTTRALYWMSWVYAYAREHKKQTKQALVFADRSDEYVPMQYAQHIVWIFWEAIRKQTGPAARPYVAILYQMYCLRWTPADAKGRQPLLTAAIVLVCEGTAIDTTPVQGDSLAVSTVLNGIPAWVDAIIRMQKSMAP
jgi:hypothetical protein